MYWISDYIKTSSLYISLISSTNSKASGYLVVKERRKLPSALLQANMGAKQMLATKILHESFWKACWSNLTRMIQACQGGSLGGL